MQNILVTGGAGYIGSHICLKLRESGYCPVVFDNLSNGHRDAIEPDIPFIQADIRDSEKLDRTFSEFQPTAVIHMAALIEAGLSMQEPSKFYNVNVAGLDLLDERLPVRPENPYGRSKAMVETMLADYFAIYGFKAIALRYFNAAGADPTGRAGERHDPETHLIPLALQAAAGLRSEMKIFGSDYDTPDGTCIRDYIHVDDLAEAHVKAVQNLTSRKNTTFEIINIGTGKGYSVKEIIELCQSITGRNFPVSLEPRRPGDPAKLVADPAKAKVLLDWQPKYGSAHDIIKHSWNFYMKTMS